MANTDTPTNFEDFFGSANIGGSFEKTVYHKIKDGTNSYRIAPPNRSLAQAGRWWVRGDLHYGYTLPNEKDPSKPFHKPFLCIQKKNFDTGMITEECPECTLIARKLKALQDLIGTRIEANLKAGMDEATAEREAEGSVKLMKRWFQEHNLDRKIYVLAKSESGEWGVLGIRGAGRKAVEEAFKKYEKQTGKNPLDARGGVWVDITRSGTGVNTVYSASVVLVPQTGGGFNFKDGGLTQADMVAITALPDLNNLHDRNRLNYDQIKVLVDGDNNPESVGRIFRASVRTSTTRAPTLGDVVRETHAIPAAAAPVPAATWTPPVAAAPVVAPEPAPAVTASPVPDVAAMMAQMEALQKMIAAVQTAAPVPAPVATTASGSSTPAKSVKDMSPEEFARKFGNL